MGTRINNGLMIDIRHDFVVRMRSIGKTRKEIEQLNAFLEATLVNVNDLNKLSRP